MCKTLIFGGTSEGRELAELCAKNGVPVWVSVATDYGASLLGGVKVLTGRLTEGEMFDLITQNGFDLVVDATHPFAREATANIRRACIAAGARLVRVVRETAPANGGRYFDDMADLIKYLSREDGNILVTTGSKELAAFCALANYRARCAVRVLAGAAESCAQLGFAPERIITGVGPFSKETNMEHIRKFDARFVVTKDSGAAGGLSEKLAAAKELGVETLILKRPKESGVSISEAKRIILEGGRRK